MEGVGRDFTRRGFQQAAALTASHFTVSGLFAEELVRKTPEMTPGPLYPDKLPLDTDNDLIIVSDSITPAVGQITHLSGRILDARGDPIRDALIEIWQVDSTTRSAPHVHFMIKVKGRPAWSTQLYIQGHPGNSRDGLYRSIGDPNAQAAVTVPFLPVEGSRIGELTAKFDIVPGFTPAG